MYWDLLKVDLFRCQMHSNKLLVSFAAITVSLVSVYGISAHNHPASNLV